MKVLELLSEIAQLRTYQPHNPTGLKNYRILRKAYDEKMGATFIFDGVSMPEIPAELVPLLYAWSRNYLDKNKHGVVYNKLGSNFKNISDLVNELQRRQPKINQEKTSGN